MNVHSFALTAGLATQILAVQGLPASVPFGIAVTPAPRAQLRDAVGNNVPQSGVAVTAEVPGATLSGATVNTDKIPTQPVEMQGFNPNQIAQLAAQNSNPNIITTVPNALFYKPPVGSDFGLFPPIYLLILGLFIVSTLVLVAYFQRRKDTVR